MDTVIDQLVKEAAYHAAEYDRDIDAIRSICRTFGNDAMTKTAAPFGTFMTPSLMNSSLRATASSLPKSGKDLLRTVTAPATGYLSGISNGPIVAGFNNLADLISKKFPNNDALKKFSKGIRNFRKDAVNMTVPENLIGKALYYPAYYYGMIPGT